MMGKLVRYSLLGLALTGSTRPAGSQEARLLRAVNMNRRGVPTANYSGITSIGGNRYALVSDKEPTAGYYPLVLELDAGSGKVKHLQIMPFHPDTSATAIVADNRFDCEGVAFVPQTGTLFISNESDQSIREYTLEGRPTGRQLHIPAAMQSQAIHPNYGFEALTYDERKRLFWTTTESTLKADGQPAGAGSTTGNLLRLQAFGTDLKPAAQYVYLTDVPEARRRGSIYAFGVPALTALPDGQLLVMEREFFVSPSNVGSWVRTRIYRVNPADGQAIGPQDTSCEQLLGKALNKVPVVAFTTRLTVFNWRLANYEGMCLGPRLADGRQTLLLVCDSQGGYGKGKIRLKDYLRVVILP